MTRANRSKTIAELNDLFRKGERPDLGRIMLTRGVRDLAAAKSLGEIAIYVKVQTFDTFTEDNDPYEEHDFGHLEFAGETCFWKIDLYKKGDVKHRLDRPSRVRRRVDALPPIAANLLHCNLTPRWIRNRHETIAARGCVQTTGALVNAVDGTVEARARVDC